MRRRFIKVFSFVFFKKSRIKQLIIAGLTLILLLNYKNSNQFRHSGNNTRTHKGNVISSSVLSRDKNHQVVILFWTKYFGKSDFFSDRTRVFRFSRNLSEPFERCEEPEAHRCVITNNRSLLGESDAVIFHIRDLNIDNDMPFRRWPNQRWIFYLLESPPHTGKRNQRHKAKQQLMNLPHSYRFNWTMTYRFILNPFLKPQTDVK